MCIGKNTVANQAIVNKFLEVQKTNGTKIQKKYKESTVESVKVLIKMFFKWLNKPEVIEHIKVKTVVDTRNDSGRMQTPDKKEHHTIFIIMLIYIMNNYI